MNSNSDDCPFCRPAPERLLEETALTRVILDGFPVSPGHTLITTVRHISGFFDLTNDELIGLREGLWSARIRLQSEHGPDGFNIGVNVGEAAGQTIEHVHIHLIPRYKGDVQSPRGGVRGVIPGKRFY